MAGCVGSIEGLLAENQNAQKVKEKAFFSLSLKKQKTKKQKRCIYNNVRIFGTPSILNCLTRNRDTAVK